MNITLKPEELIVTPSDRLLITGSNGFIGSRVVKTLLDYGFSNLRCFIRPSGNRSSLEALIAETGTQGVEILEGNLLSPEDCEHAVAGVSVICHLAAGIDKSFPGAFMNSVVTTRNLLEAAVKEGRLKRMVNISSFAVYDNKQIRRGGLMTEEAPLEKNPVVRGEAYCYGKVKQDELVLDYAQKYNLPVVILRPGAVFGPGRAAITGRIGIDTFGVYFHLGGSNTIPFTYVDNCAEAIALAGLKKGVDGQVFNVVDDDLPTSREFLRLYKKNVQKFKSVYIPYPIFYLFSHMWEKYSVWSKGQFPPAFNRSRARTEWKGNRYSNRKLKEMLGWSPSVPMPEALSRYFAYQREALAG